MRSARVLFCLLFVIGFLWLTSPKTIFAQVLNNGSSSTTPGNTFTSPNMDSNVPLNQHTYAQAVTIEVLSAVMCQLTGIDSINPSTPCLDINPATKKLGYVQQSTNNPLAPPRSGPQLGGILGITTDMIAYTFSPVASTETYTSYLSDNFGITKKAYAATGPDCTSPTHSYGFCGLGPVFTLWMTVRNIAYSLLVIAFIFIGVGIMLRIKIDPRTVMTIQNQIPKVIICMILITFSYAIAAFLIDVMWVSTYAGINMINDASPVVIRTNKQNESLGTMATKNLLEIPFYFVNNVFHTGPKAKDNPGIFHITSKVSGFTGNLLRNIIRDTLGVDKGDKCFSLRHGIQLQACFATLMGWVAGQLVKIVVLVILIVALFKTWFNLLKAFIYTLLYVIVSPVMIVFGLLPSKPMGFANWMKRLFVNIAVFPLTAFVFVGARLLMDVYDSQAAGQLIPPLIGHNSDLNFGSLLAFGAILMTPHLQTILQEKMGVKGIGSPGLFVQGITGGAAILGAPAGRAMKHFNRTDNSGQPVGLVAVKKREAGNWALGKMSKLPGVGGAAGRFKERRDVVENLSAYESKGKALREKKAEQKMRKKAQGNPNHDYWKQEDKEGNPLHPYEAPKTWRQRRTEKKEEKEAAAHGGSAGTTSTPTKGGRFRRIFGKKNEGGFIRTPKSLRKPPESTQTSQPTATNEAQTIKERLDAARLEAAKLTPGASRSTSPSASPAETHVGTGTYTITGPVTATGQLIAHGGSQKEAKRNLAMQMYNNYKKGSATGGGAAISGRQEITIKQKLEETIEEKSVDEVREMKAPEWQHTIEQFHKEAADEEKSGGGTGEKA